MRSIIFDFFTISARLELDGDFAFTLLLFSRNARKGRRAADTIRGIDSRHVAAPPHVICADRRDYDATPTPISRRHDVDGTPFPHAV